MKQLLIGLMVVVLSSCATNADNVASAEKYEFDNLETVSSIYNFRMDSWSIIDNRSLIIESGSRESYLIVLNSTIPELDLAIAIIVSSSNGRVESGFDSVTTRRQPTLKSSIRKIYKVENESQVAEITAQITGQ